jgi:hypothetical protein
MAHKLIIALALSLGLGTAALAQQQAPGSSPSGQGQAPTVPVWDDPMINDVFFVDPAARTLRSEAEIRANWGTLSAEQQAMVRADCDARMTTAAVGANTAGLDSDPTTSGTDGAGVAGPNVAGGTAPGAQTTNLCAILDNM